ncbi:hypothetical protein PIB30_067377 [Stylosanthes scabra]|uniref:Uncharacterized protein n=1 Tax=Stylosanthes scabra TaxID=79078 RepID=A0ABU6VL49_9FABA|nr:hypothetical protein [Stylosanthes scabra]
MAVEQLISAMMVVEERKEPVASDGVIDLFMMEKENRGDGGSRIENAKIIVQNYVVLAITVLCESRDHATLSRQAGHATSARDIDVEGNTSTARGIGIGQSNQLWLRY